MKRSLADIVSEPFKALYLIKERQLKMSFEVKERLDKKQKFVFIICSLSSRMYFQNEIGHVGTHYVRKRNDNKWLCERITNHIYIYNRSSK